MKKFIFLFHLMDLKKAIASKQIKYNVILFHLDRIIESKNK